MTMKYPNVYLPDVEAKIFYKMWGELATLGKLSTDHKVLCPICLFPKSAEELTLEHIIPKSALRHDPPSLKRAHPLNHRSGLTLLCRQCNGLKGTFYDPVIEKLFRFPSPTLGPKQDQLAFKSRRILGYLGAFRELGYSYILSGKKFDSIRHEIQNPYLPSSFSGINFITAAFQTSHPHQYFNGWCDVFDETGNRTHSVFSCYDDLRRDTIQVRARHLSITLPAGKRAIIVPKSSGTGLSIGIDLSKIQK